MADTVYVDTITLLTADTMNDLNRLHYTILGDPGSAGAVLTVLGLNTSDSPQFTGINLGHASDTTLTRVSAGVVAIEGVNILTTATGAALAGSASQTFSVGTATDNAHATTKAQMDSGDLMVLLSTQTASNSASLDFTSAMSATYENYMLELLDLLPATDGQNMNLLTDTNNGASFTAAGYTWCGTNNTAPTTNGTIGSASDSGIRLGRIVGNSAGNGLSGTVKIAATANNTRFVYQTNWINNAGALDTLHGAADSPDVTCNALRIIMASGNLTSGVARLYGIKK